MPKISESALREVREALKRYEEEVTKSSLRLSTKSTYLQHPERFIRWMEDKYELPGADELR